MICDHGYAGSDDRCPVCGPIHKVAGLADRVAAIENRLEAHKSDPVRLLLDLRFGAWLVARDVETVAPRGLSMTQVTALFAVEAEPGLRPIDLAARLHQAKSNAKAHLNVLEQGGLGGLVRAGN